MAEGCIYIYTGDGRGKSPAAIGRAVQAAVEGKRVVIIQFLKGKGLGDSDFLRRMEPEIKLFRFEKSDGNFVELPEEKKQEEIQNIRNGIGFAKKVLTTGECDLLILDEVLGLVEKDIITEDDLKFYNGNLEHIFEPGEFELMVGPNSRDVKVVRFEALGIRH